MTHIPDRLGTRISVGARREKVAELARALKMKALAQCVQQGGCVSRWSPKGEPQSRSHSVYASDWCEICEELSIRSACALYTQPLNCVKLRKTLSQGVLKGSSLRLHAQTAPHSQSYSMRRRAGDEVQLSLRIGICEGPVPLIAPRACASVDRRLRLRPGRGYLGGWPGRSPHP